MLRKSVTWQLARGLLTSVAPPTVRLVHVVFSVCIRLLLGMVESEGNRFRLQLMDKEPLGFTVPLTSTSQ